MPKSLNYPNEDYLNVFIIDAFTHYICKHWNIDYSSIVPILSEKLLKPQVALSPCRGRFGETAFVP